MSPRLPMPPDRSRTLPVVAGVVLLGVLRLVGPSPVAAATFLQNPSASPPSGTTETPFVLSVDYVSESDAREAVSVAVEVVGLGGGPFPMAPVSGTATNGTWATSTMLPAGSWQLVFTAVSEGPPPQQPAPIDGPVVVVTTAPTPTPAPTPGGETPTPSPTPTPAPTAAATVTPAPTTNPTPTSVPTSVPAPVPTPLPPGATPAETPPPTSGGPAPPSPASTGPPPSPSSTATDGAAPTVGPTKTAGTVAPGGSDPPSVAPAEDRSGGAGWGRTGWVVLGGMTSVTGLVVLARQWLARRAGTGSG